MFIHSVMSRLARCLLLTALLGLKAVELTVLEICEQNDPTDDYVNAIKINCSGEGNVLISWKIPDDILEAVLEINIGYVCYTAAVDLQDPLLYEDIDTMSTYTSFKTNETNCLAVGCIQQQKGRGSSVWRNLNNGSCSFNTIDEGELVSVNLDHLTSVTTSSTVKFLPDKTSAYSNKPTTVPVPIMTTTTTTTATSSSPVAQASDELQPQIIITGVTLSSSLLFFVFVAVILCISTGVWRKHKHSKADEKTDTPEIIAYSLSSTSLSASRHSITTICDDPLPFQSPSTASSKINEFHIISDDPLLAVDQAMSVSGKDTAMDGSINSSADAASFVMTDDDHSLQRNKHFTIDTSNSSSYVPSSSGYISDAAMQAADLPCHLVGSCDESTAAIAL